MIDGIVGVIIWTEDLDRLFAFYRNTLGLEAHSIRPEFIAFKWGYMRLSIGKHAEVKGRTNSVTLIFQRPTALTDTGVQLDTARTEKLPNIGTTSSQTVGVQTSIYVSEGANNGRKTARSMVVSACLVSANHGRHRT